MSSACDVFNPKAMPNAALLQDYGNDNLETLLKFYGTETTVSCSALAATGTTPADVDADATGTEWRSFNLTMKSEFSKCTLQEMLASLHNRPTVFDLYPNLMFLMQVAVTLPVGTATMERSFSDMKEIKTRLRNRIMPGSLSRLMRIAIEGGR